MTVVCDACETALSMEVSDCCGADIWWEGRAMEDREICKECGKDCVPIKKSEWLKKDDNEKRN